LSTIPPSVLVTGQIPSSLSTKITTIYAIIVSPTRATRLTQFIHDFISRGEERKLQMSLLRHSMDLPTTSTLPQVQMLPKQLFTSYARHVGEKGLLELLKRDTSTKSSSEVSSFLVTTTTTTKTCFWPCLFLCESFPIKCFL